jgi:hypothetical protein
MVSGHFPQFDYSPFYGAEKLVYFVEVLAIYLPFISGSPSKDIGQSPSLKKTAPKRRKTRSL